METCKVCKTKQTPRDEELKKNLTKRLNRIEGQIRGINKMVQENVYCEEILIQMTAAKKALDSVGVILLENHIKTCVVEQIEKKDYSVIDELLSVVKKMIK